MWRGYPGEVPGESVGCGIEAAARPASGSQAAVGKPQKRFAKCRSGRKAAIQDLDEALNLGICELDTVHGSAFREQGLYASRDSLMVRRWIAPRQDSDFCHMV